MQRMRFNFFFLNIKNNLCCSYFDDYYFDALDRYEEVKVQENGDSGGGGGGYCALDTSTCERVQDAAGAPLRSDWRNAILRDLMRARGFTYAPLRFWRLTRDLPDMGQTYKRPLSYSERMLRAYGCASEFEAQRHAGAELDASLYYYHDCLHILPSPLIYQPLFDLMYLQFKNLALEEVKKNFKK